MCVATDAERLMALKRASVGASWELVGGATSLERLADDLAEWRPDVVVLEAAMAPAAVSRVRDVHPGIRLVAVGEAQGVDAVAESLEGVRDAILGVPKPGGPVTG
jgi:hypothetical protein